MDNVHFNFGKRMGCLARAFTQCTSRRSTLRTNPEASYGGVRAEVREMLSGGEHNGMITILMTIAFAQLDGKFCPLAPSPKHYTDNIGMRVNTAGQMTTPLSAEVAARLVDTRITKSDNTIGWLYLDELGLNYVILKPYVSSETYVAFGMNGFNHYRPDTYTEAKVQAPLRLPKGIEIRSCTEPD